MKTITTNEGVHVHADLHELTRIRQQITASQLALWGDHSSKIAQMFGLANNDIADIILNDCGLVVFAIENPEIGLAIGTSLTAIWLQLSNLNALCDLVQSKYQIGETTIDRKMALEHQMLEVAATAPFFAKLHLFGGNDSDDSKHKTESTDEKGATPPTTTSRGNHPIQAPTVGLPPREVDGPPADAKGLSPEPVCAPGSAQSGELQDSEELQSGTGYKGNHAQN